VNGGNQGQPGLGGAASSTAVAANPGSRAATATATGVGGDGGGPASALATATTSSGVASAVATANGGIGGTGGTNAKRGRADAWAIATGGPAASALASGNGGDAAGTFSANATSHGNRFSSVRAAAVAPAAGIAKVDSRVTIAGSAPAPSSPLTSIAYATASPTAADANAALMNNPHLMARMAPPGQVIALGALAGSSGSANATSHAYTTSIGMTADFADVTGPHDLMLGFHDPVVAGLGFDSLEMMVRRHGTTLFDQVFTSVPVASAYLTDRLVDLGSLNSAGFDSLDLDVTMTLTTARPAEGLLANLVLASVPTTPGDANHDGSVDFLDLAQLAQNYNVAGGRTFEQGDFNGDGNVDFLDLAQLAQRYNQPLQAGSVAGAPAGFEEAWASASAAVPEPSAAVLLTFFGTAYGLNRRRRRSLDPGHVTSCFDHQQQLAPLAARAGRLDRRDHQPLRRGRSGCSRT
jgi:hypothetical protein